HCWALVILAAYLALGVVYSTTTPLWEGDMEWAHYRFMRYLALTHRLPPLPDVNEEFSSDGRLRNYWQFTENRQYSQPPLYYALGGLIISSVNLEDDLWPVTNLYGFHASALGGANVAIHGGEEAWPYRGTVLAAHLARWYSILLGAITVWLTYLTVRLIMPGQPAVALLAMAVNGFAPTFLFESSVINNDIMVTMFGSLATYFMLRILLRDARWQDFLWLAIAISLALLSKYNAIALIAPAATLLVVLLYQSWRSGSLSKRRLAALLTLPTGLLILSGWWFLRNKLVHGAYIPRFIRLTTRIAQEPETIRNRFQALSATEAFDSLVRALNNFWAAFGWGERIHIHPLLYIVLYGLMVLAALGVLLWLRRERRFHPTIAVLILAVTIIAYWAQGAGRLWAQGSKSVQGRYMLPSMPAMAVLMALGLSSLMPHRRASLIAVLVGGGFFLSGALAIPLYLRPAYARPPLLQPDDLAMVPHPLRVTFDHKAELVGYDLWPEHVYPGGGVGVTLWWRALALMDKNYTVGVHLLGRNLQPIAAIDRYPGKGNFATSLWRPGDIFRETYWLKVDPQADAPALAQVAVILFLDNPDEKPQLPVYDAQGNPIGDWVVFGRLALRSPRTALPQHIQHPLRADFGDQIELLGYRWGPLMEAPCRQLPLHLYWRAQKTPKSDYTVFIHLLDEEGNQVLAQDGPPRRGSYPTDLWAPGEVITDNHRLRFPPWLPGGRYSLLVGLYERGSGVRLPAYKADGQRWSDDRVLLGEIDLPPVHQIFIPYIV
ncbi:MAG TPA: phospholipid carrier-dependent glycosyltransferase, partial [Anaerolineae bacterium]|nr:phospholipid carrier-dependent glycosyltransferase [Anaerolineae bacterium]